MGMRFFAVTVRNEAGAEREIRAPSKTEVQAGDAVQSAMRPGEAIVSVREIKDDYQRADVGPPGTQTHPDQIV